MDICDILLSNSGAEAFENNFSSKIKMPVRKQGKI